MKITLKNDKCGYIDFASYNTLAEVLQQMMKAEEMLEDILTSGADIILSKD